MAYWLFKSEPDAYSIDCLKKDARTPWDGVRNYQARNLQQQMEIGDIGFFYHSRVEPPAVVGLCRVSKKAFPDASAFDSSSRYYDPKSSPERPRWFNVELEYLCHMPVPVSLTHIKATAGLKNMVLVKNSRLSVQAVTELEFKTICAMGHLNEEAYNKKGGRIGEAASGLGL